MITSENLDHSPQAVTLETMPNGTKCLWLRKEITKKTSDAPDGETGGTTYDCTTAYCQLEADRTDVTADSVANEFDNWWEYAAAWTGAEQTPTLEERISAIETMLMEV